MASFQDILKRKASEIKPPPAYPVGSYHCLVDGLPEQQESNQKGTPCRVYKFKIMQPMSDVNRDDLAKIEGGVQGKILSGQGVGTAFYITEASVFMYKAFLAEALGIDPKEGTPEEKSIEQMEAEAPGKQLIVKLKHDVSQDGKRLYHRVDGFAHV